MDDDAAGEVMDAHPHQVVQESVRMPGPVGERTVDEDAEEHHEYEIGGELRGDNSEGDSPSFNPTFHVRE